MMKAEKESEFNGGYALSDSWYSFLENLKTISEYGWHFFTRLKSNRFVNPDRTCSVPVSSIDIPPQGEIVRLKSFGMWKCSARSLKKETLTTGQPTTLG